MQPAPGLTLRLPRFRAAGKTWPVQLRPVHTAVFLRRFRCGLRLSGFFAEVRGSSLPASASRASSTHEDDAVWEHNIVLQTGARQDWDEQEWRSGVCATNPASASPPVKTIVPGYRCVNSLRMTIA
jgi:hypothetical protein